MIRVRMIFAIVPLAFVTALLMISRHAWGTAGHPPGLLRKFLAIVEEKPKAAFLRAAPASVKALATKDRAKIVISDRDYSAAEKEIAELRRTGKLNDSAVNRFAVTQQSAKLTVALAQASEAPVKSIESLLLHSHVPAAVPPGSAVGTLRDGICPVCAGCVGAGESDS